MTGCCVAWKCLVAWRLGESSQQPTWPQMRPSRRCTHSSPVFRHSSQPSALGVTVAIRCRCVQCLLMTVPGSRDGGAAHSACVGREPPRRRLVTGDSRNCLTLLRSLRETARMKILIVTDAWTPQINGVVRTIQMTVRELAALGHEVEILSPD